MTTESEPRPTITKVWAKNFRSIEYAELELGPLTVLVGPNASGKSNLLDILSFLADATRDGLETAITRRGGISSIGRRSPTGRALSPELGLQYKLPGGTLEYSVALMRRSNGEYGVKREFGTFNPGDSSTGQVEVELSSGRITKPNLKNILKKRESRLNKAGESTTSRIRAETRFIEELIEGLGSQDLQMISEQPWRVTSWLASLDTGTEAMGKSPYFGLHMALDNARGNLSHIGMYHIFPNSLRDPQKVADSHPLATSGENLASTLRDMVQKKSRFLSELKEALSVAVPGVRDVRVLHAGSYYVVELKHEKADNGAKGLWFDLSHESDGTIRLLAMLTALFQDPAPSLMGLEEPELAIHPGAMAVLADTMKEASLRGQVLVATHSPDLINLLPIESIRAVTAQDGSTRVGKVAEHQLKSVKDNLFLPGELHSMEGLQPAGAGKPAE